MAKKLQVSIAEPCHEDWDNMNPVEKARPDDPVGRGRFCDSCQKQVVDFTSMNDRQIAEFFKKPILSSSKGGSVCGRFMADQLDRDIDIPKKRIPWFKYFFSLLLPAIFISKASAQKMGKVSRPIPKDTTRVPVGHEIRTLGMVLPKVITPVCKDTTEDITLKGEVSYRPPQKVSRIAVNGRVVDEKGNPVPGASVLMIHNGKMISADNEGKFSFHSTKDQLIELELTSVGYQPEHYIYPFALQYSSIVDITVQMKLAPATLPEVVVTAMGLTRQSYIMGYTVSKVTKCEIVVEKDSIVQTELVQPIEIASVLVYPNPVTKGGTINISFKQMDPGYYSVQFLSVSGQMVSQREIWIDTEASVLSMEAPRVAAGTYFLVMINRKTGKKFTEKIIIE